MLNETIVPQPFGVAEPEDILYSRLLWGKVVRVAFRIKLREDFTLVQGLNTSEMFFGSSGSNLLIAVKTQGVSRIIGDI